MNETPTYTNPIYDDYMADPFVLKFNGEYYAYGTVPVGTCTMAVLHSKDLVTWRFLGDVLQPLEEEFACFWAPEVAYDNGQFYMYYSAGGDEGEGHQLRVATAPTPTGPFRDRGVILVPREPFSIDAHPFRDDDGAWYLFYSVDLLDGNRPGTSIVADRMIDMVELAGEQRVVVRPHADWNLFQRQRQWLGRVWDWFTIEGAFVRKHAGRYYCFYSGGAWKEPNYGVGCVVADHPLGPYHIATSRESPEVLRTVPEKVIGPGHMSIALAPDNVHPYIFYHAWDLDHSARLMRMDALDWTDQGPVGRGPTTDPQPAPPMPAVRDLFDGADNTPLDPARWHTESGAWSMRGGEAIQEDARARPAIVSLKHGASMGSYLWEVNPRHLHADGDGSFGVLLAYHDPRNCDELAFDAAGRELTWRRVVGGDEHDRKTLDIARLGAKFRTDVYHQLLIENRAGEVAVRLDGVLVGMRLRSSLDGKLALFTNGTAAAFDGVALTYLE